jgi:hypothetical protein
MNPLNYASPEACQRLHAKGIVLETDCYHRVWVAKATNTPCSQVATKDQMLWNKHGDDVGDGRDMDGVVYIPAPSMAEVWRELISRGWPPCSDGMSFWLCNDDNEVVTDEIIDTNPTDALIDLLIWVTEQRKEEGKQHAKVFNAINATAGLIKGETP